MINLSNPYFIGNEKKYLVNAIESNYVATAGKYINKFSDKVLNVTKSKFCVLTCSGSSALHLALLSLGVKSNELIIVPSFTFAATVNAISLTGAQPWFFDISKDDWCLDLDLLELELKKNTFFKEKNLIHKKTGQKISTIILVYTLGMPVDVIRVNKIAKKYKLRILADAACAITSKYKKLNIGQFNFDISILSFNSNKIITSGGGGALLTNNMGLYKLARTIAQNGRSDKNYRYNKIGFNYRINNIQAAVGLAQIEKINFLKNKKKWIFNYYKNNLTTYYKKISDFPSCKGRNSSYWLSGLVCDKISRTKLSKFLQYYKIANSFFWEPMHIQNPYKKFLKTKMILTEKIYKKILILPCSTSIKKNEINKVIKYVKYFLK